MASKKFTKKITRYMIYVVLASFILGGLYTNYGMPERKEDTTDQASSRYNIVSYDGERIATNPIECEITEKKNNIKIVLPQDNRVSDDDLAQVFESNITGVKSVVLEVSKSHAMFDMKVEEENAIDEVKDKIRINGARIYGAYMCNVGDSTVEVIGQNLTVGENINILLVERSRAGFSEIIGFQQG
ncbi:MAG: hypothetical protein KKD39_06320 [Candidatus Altiarchaeota archaeon]|nr:hypothetical protein [Candidatus Altiarchaeota archaeon]